MREPQTMYKLSLTSNFQAVIMLLNGALMDQLRVAILPIHSLALAERDAKQVRTYDKTPL